MAKKTLVKSDLIKVPKSRIKKDLSVFVLISCFTFTLIIGYYVIENDPLNFILREFDLEYFDSKNQSSFGIEGSKYITTDMKLKFTCNVPRNTKTVMIKLDDDPDWIHINTSKSFTLTAKYPSVYTGNYTLFFRCDNQIFYFITTIYKQDLPIFKIFTSSEIYYEQKKCNVIVKTISQESNREDWANRKIIAQIQKRNSGNGYSLELEENLALFDMREDDDWILLPSKETAGALRTKLAFDIYKILGIINPLCRISNAEPVDLYINDRYIGLFLLTERVDQKLYGLKNELSENNENIDMLFKGESWVGDSETLWEQIYPNKISLSEYPLKLDKFIQAATEREFFDKEDGIFTRINRLQIIDFLLFGLLVGHNSLEGFKFYLVRNGEYGKQYYFTPWDFDVSWGYSRTTLYSPYYWLSDNEGSTGFLKWNHLFYRLIFPKIESNNEQFMEDIKNRWFLLRNFPLLKTEHLRSIITRLFQLMRSGLIRNNIEENVDQIYEEIIKWTTKRIEIIDGSIGGSIPSNLPSIYIKCKDNINPYEYVNCSLETFHSFPLYKSGIIKSKIIIRGTQFWKLYKKGYRLEFYKNEPILGMRDDDDWILFAMYFDFTRMRIKMSLDLWRSLLPLNPTAILPNSKYVNLFINEEFNGIYLLAEKNDKKLFNLNISQTNCNSSLIFQAKHYPEFDYYLKSDWEQDWPNIEEVNIIDEILTELISFVNSTSDQMFFNAENGIYSKFDKLNLIDFFLFNFFIIHQDFWDHNYYIVRNTNPSKFFLCPWDFDGSFGQWGWIVMDYRLNGLESIKSKNLLYKRLLNNLTFLQDCKDRWFELRELIWTEKFMMDELSSNYNEIKNILSIEMYNFPWKPITVEKHPRYPWLESTEEFELDEYINCLYEFIPKRLEFIDNFFSEI